MDINQITSAFTYHAPKPGQPEKYTAVANTAVTLYVGYIDFGTGNIS